MTELLKEFRSADGTGNNGNFNVVDAAESRIAPANFAPGTTNGLIDAPNAREISNVVSSGERAEDHDPNGLSAWMYVWGQFIDHDMDHTNNDGINHIDIPIPKDDPDFPGGNITTTRFVTDPSTGTAVNDITGWIDGSMVYGSSQKTANSLRTEDGHLTTSGDGQYLALDDKGRYASGDIRVSENPNLTVTTTLFVREHNYQVDRLHAEHPEWSGDQLYKMAKAIVGAEIANITYSEFLPHLLGPDAIKPYHGFDPNADPRITQEFSTSAFRFGHSIVSGSETKTNNNGEEMAPPQSLADAFTNTPAMVQAHDGIDGLLRTIAADPTQANDVFAVNELRNLLNAPPAFIDLIAIDIQRERDLGVGSLNQTRESLGLSPYTDFNQITDDPEIAASLKKAFGNVDDVSLFIGGLAETHASGSMLGETFRRIIADQFESLRDGDRLWWENQGFDEGTAQQIRNTTLSDIHMRNTDTNFLQKDVFVASARHSSDVPPEDAGLNEIVLGIDEDNAEIKGGDKDDIIVSGLGKNQMLTGGNGRDVFIVSGESQEMTITDFDPMEDILKFQMGAGDFNVACAPGGNGSTIHYGDNTVHLMGVAVADLPAKNVLLPSDLA